MKKIFFSSAFWREIRCTFGPCADMASLDGNSEARVENVSTDGIDRAEMAAQLSGATSAIAGQLQMITEEMSRLRSEIYSDNGLGSIKKELEQLRSGGARSPSDMHHRCRHADTVEPSRQQVWSRCKRSWRASRPPRRPRKEEAEV